MAQPRVPHGESSEVCTPTSRNEQSKEQQESPSPYYPLQGTKSHPVNNGRRTSLGHKEPSPLTVSGKLTTQPMEHTRRLNDNNLSEQAVHAMYNRLPILSYGEYWKGSDTANEADLQYFDCLKNLKAEQKSPSSPSDKVHGGSLHLGQIPLNIPEQLASKATTSTRERNGSNVTGVAPPHPRTNPPSRPTPPRWHGAARAPSALPPTAVPARKAAAASPTC